MKSGIFHPRHLLFVLPLLFLFTSICINKLRYKWLILSGCLLCVASQYNNIYSYYKQPKEGYKECVGWLSETMGKNNNTLVITTHSPNKYFYKYYLDKYPNRFRQISLPNSGEASNVYIKYITDVTEFGIINHYTHEDAVAPIRSLVEKDFELIGERQWGGIDVHVWRRK